MKKIVKLSAVLFFTLLMGCSLFRPSVGAESLYYRIGEEEGTQKIVDNFMVEILLDPRLNTSFIKLASDKNTLNQFKLEIFTFICNQGGGNCALTPKSQRTTKDRVQLDQNQLDIYLDKFTTILYDSRISGIDREFLVQKTIPLLTSLIEIRK